MRIGDHIIPRRAALDKALADSELGCSDFWQCEHCGKEQRSGEEIYLYRTRYGRLACGACWQKHDEQARLGAITLGILEDLKPGDDLEALLRKAAGMDARLSLAKVAQLERLEKADALPEVSP